MDNKKELLIKSFETLNEISKQWELKNLEGDFFKLPYELTELIREINIELENE